MEALEAAGAIHFWGYTSAINFFSHYKEFPKTEINILLSGTSDIRHVLRSLSLIKHPNEIPINVFFHEFMPRFI